MRRPFLLVLALTATTACGGGGSSTNAPAAPSVGATPPATNAPTSAPSPTSNAATKIQHVVIIVQENRSPDNLFHGLPGADIANSGVASDGTTVALQPIPLANSYDIDHSHTAFVTAYDGGKNDRSDQERVSCGTACPYAHPEFGYVPASDNAPYMQMAQQYTFADRMFQTNEGPSYPAHQYLISGTSEPADGSNLLVSENTSQAGCTAPADARVSVIDLAGSEAQSVYPCFEHRTLMDLLDAKGLSWRYYTPNIGIWAAPNSIAHIRNGPGWNNVIFDNTQVLSDARNGTLPNVSWVIPTAAASDHARGNDGSGPSWVASIVNAIGSSPAWKSTAIFVVWDDWGGWYDHVVPRVYGPYELGFRVPLLVVSPYAKRGYVSHATHEFGSILRFTERAFGLDSIGTTDVRSDDLSDCFDFTNGSGKAFVPFATRFDARYFAARSASTALPDDDY